MSERANKARSAEQAICLKQMSERCEHMNKRTSEWSNIYIPIFVFSSVTRQKGQFATFLRHFLGEYRKRFHIFIWLDLKEINKKKNSRRTRKRHGERKKRKTKIGKAGKARDKKRRKMRKEEEEKQEAKGQDWKRREEREFFPSAKKRYLPPLIKKPILRFIAQDC